MTDAATIKFVIVHFRNYRRLGTWAFLWRINLEATVVSILVALALVIIGVPSRHPPIMSVEAWIAVGVVVAPLFETLVFQALPIKLARRAKARFAEQVGCSTFLFAAAHALSNGLGSGLCAGLVGGFYHAFTYAHFRARSYPAAFWATSLSHATHNAIAIAIAIRLGEI